jgi:hypothetical protein
MHRLCLRICVMDRRQFALGSIPAALLAGCRSATKPARDATLFHNRAVRTAVANMDEAVNMVDERLSGFGPENWRDALSNLQTAAIRLRSDMEELRRALGYAETAATQPPDPLDNSGDR